MTAQQTQTLLCLFKLVRKLNVISRNIDMDRTFMNRYSKQEILAQARAKAKESTSN